jgi:hypothetical protein
MLLCCCLAALSGCSTSRVLDQPFKSGENALALIVYTDKPSALVEQGKNGYDEVICQSFYEWFYGAFSDHYQGAGVYLFNRDIVNNFAIRHDAAPITGRLENVNVTQVYDKPYYCVFPDTVLSGLFAAAEELGATHIIKGSLINYKRQKYQAVRENKDPLTASYSRVETANLRIDAEVNVTVFSVCRKEMLFQRTFSVSYDKNLFQGEFMGDHNVRKSLAEAVIRAIATEESAKAGFVQTVASSAKIILQGGLEIPDWTVSGMPTRSKILYPSVTKVSRIGPDLLDVSISLYNTTDYPLQIRFDQHRLDRKVMRLVSDDGVQFLLNNDAILNDGVSIRPGERSVFHLVFNCPDSATSQLTMEGDWVFSVPHYTAGTYLKWTGLPNR